MDDNRIGQILTELGILTSEQVSQVLASQAERRLPFGQLAETMFGLDACMIHQALADQIARRAPYIKLCRQEFDPDVLALLTPREAWDTLVLPICREDGEVLIATTVETLTSAIDLLQEKLIEPYHFALVEMRPIEEFIANLYAYEGVEVTEENEAA